VTGGSTVYFPASHAVSPYKELGEGRGRRGFMS